MFLRIIRLLCRILNNDFIVFRWIMHFGKWCALKHEVIIFSALGHIADLMSIFLRRAPTCITDMYFMARSTRNFIGLDLSLKTIRIVMTFHKNMEYKYPTPRHKSF